MQQGLFRQVALERLSSPDQLDRLMRVTDPKTWLALAALTALTLAVVLWSVFGSVATSVRTQGVVIREGGNYIIRASPQLTWRQTTPVNNWGVHLSLAAGQSLTSANFGESQKA